MSAPSPIPVLGQQRAVARRLREEITALLIEASGRHCLMRNAYKILKAAEDLVEIEEEIESNVSIALGLASAP